MYVELLQFPEKRGWDMCSVRKSLRVSSLVALPNHRSSATLCRAWRGTDSARAGNIPGEHGRQSPWGALPSLTALPQGAKTGHEKQLLDHVRRKEWLPKLHKDGFIG